MNNWKLKLKNTTTILNFTLVKFLLVRFNIRVHLSRPFWIGISLSIVLVTPLSFVLTAGLINMYMCPHPSHLQKLLTRSNWVPQWGHHGIPLYIYFNPLNNTLSSWCSTDVLNSSVLFTRILGETFQDALLKFKYLKKAIRVINL